VNDDTGAFQCDTHPHITIDYSDSYCCLCAVDDVIAEVFEHTGWDDGQIDYAIKKLNEIRKGRESQ